MNKIINITVIAAIVAALTITAMPSKAFAKKECFTQYGGGETCVEENEEGKLDVDKTIWSPKTKDFENNISKSDYKFSKGEYIKFRIRVKNTGDIRLEDIKLVDILPSFVKYSSGDGDGKNDDSRVEFNRFDLNPGDSKEFTFRTKVNFDGVTPKDSTICLTNIATAEGKHDNDKNDKEKDSDYSNFCIKVSDKRVLGKESPKRLPVTGGSLEEGQNDMAKLILAGSISAGLILVGFGLKKISN